MAEQDFLGSWTVSKTAGTPFGIGTPIEITMQSELTVTFDGARVDVEYVDSTNMLVLKEIAGLTELVVAVLQDPDESSSYRALYGVGRSTNVLDKSKNLVVCSAQAAADAGAIAKVEGKPQPTGTATATEEGAYLLATTSGTQYGINSSVSWVPDDDGVKAWIKNALGQDMLVDFHLDPVNPEDGTAVTFQGVDTSQGIRLLLQYSLVTLEGDERRTIFGINVVGDPENSGVWGGDDVGPN